MAAKSNSDLSPESPDQQMCQLCQVPVQSAVRTAHERGLNHQAARQIAAVALDRWRAHMAADDALREPLPEPLDTENVIFCDICTEAVPSTSYPRHVNAKVHLIAALDEKVFEELVRVYVDEEDLKLLEASAKTHSDDDGSTGQNSDANTTYKCHICALKVPSAFKSEHERSVHHRTRVALATAAGRRTSAFLHDRPPMGIPGKRNIKMIELLKSYTGIDLMMKNVEDVEDVEKEVVVDEKASQSEVKKRLTAKQYFTDILPYVQHTEALYTLIIDDTEFVTIKNTNGTCMRVHVANFNGITYSNSEDAQYDMKCVMCHGYNQYTSYSSKLGHDKLHVMSLGHIRHVLAPIDNVHGIRKINSGQSFCVLCNRFLLDYNLENHIFNDIHHTANLSTALKLGKNFNENRGDLKIITYSPRVGRSNFTWSPVKNYDGVLHPFNNFPQNSPFGGTNVVPQGGNVSKPQGQSLFGASNSQMTGFGASNASTNFGVNGNTASGIAFGVGTNLGASLANTGASFGAQPASGSVFGARASGGLFGASNASTGALGTTSASTGFNTSPSNTGASFGAQPASGSVFGTRASGGLFGASNASTGALGTTSASTGFNTSPSNTGASFGAQPASGSVFGTRASGGLFGASNASTGALGTTSASTGFNTSPSNTGASFGAQPASGSVFGASNAAFGNTGKNCTTVGTTNSGTAFGGPPKTGTILGGGTFGTTQPDATPGGTVNSENASDGTIHF